MKISLLLTGLLIGQLIAPLSTHGQSLQPGFQKTEALQMLLCNARTATSASYYTGEWELPEPEFKPIYTSEEVGQSNAWSFWGKEGAAVISIRGTVWKPESWLANYYSAMLPARGKIQLDAETAFDYNLAIHAKAAVHAGWLISMAYLMQDIAPQLKMIDQSGIKNLYITGHSQGGAIAYLLTAHLLHLQATGAFPANIQIKTYCTAAPKPGNSFFASELEYKTQAGWLFNLSNIHDWVPLSPPSIQSFQDFPDHNPFGSEKPLIKDAAWPKELDFDKVYGKLQRQLEKSQEIYAENLGESLKETIQNVLPEMTHPPFVSSTDYVKTGTFIHLIPQEGYTENLPSRDEEDLFIHHYHHAYVQLLNSAD